MKRIQRILLSGAAAALLLAPAVSAGTTAPDELQQKYEKKLAKEFIQFGGWITDFDEARATAKKEGKVLFVYFSRSYAP